MTITNQNCDVTFVGNGSSTVWPFTFEIPTAGDLIVTVTTVATGAEVVLSPTVYSVIGLGLSTGGYVTYPIVGTPLSSAFKITISRSVPYVQETDLVNQDGFYPEVVEGAMDYIVMQTQQLKDENNRQLTYPITEAGTTSRFLPDANTRAGKYFGFDGAGNPTVYSAAAGGGGGTLATVASIGADVDNVATVQAVVDDVSAAGGGTVLMLNGTYGWNGSVLVPSNVEVLGEGYGTCIYPLATMGLTVPALRNPNQTPIAAYVRTDSRIRISNIRFDGSRRTYPEYLQDSGGAPVTSPATDPTRNTSTYATGGYMIHFSMAADVEVSDCFFENHGSFVVVITGCLQARVNRNGFFNCGRLGYSSNAIFVGHAGTMEQIGTVTKGVDTVFNFVGTNASVTAATNVYIWGCKGLSNLFPNGVYAVKSSTSTSITLETDSSAATDFIFDGRCCIGTALTTISERCEVRNNWGFAMKRALVQVGVVSGCEVDGTEVRNGTEGAIFVASGFDVIVSNTLAENIDMADIVADIIEINYGVNVVVDGLIARNCEAAPLNVVGCAGLILKNIFLLYPNDNPLHTYPYGPFGEAGDWVGTITTVNGNAAATISPSINFSPASAPNSRLTGKLICANAAARTDISWAADGATAVTLSPVATAGGTVAARINWYSANVSTTPGEPVQTTKKYAIILNANNTFPVRDVVIEDVKVQDEFGYTPGAILMTVSAGATAGSIYNVKIRNLDTTRLGKRGVISGITNAASAVITTPVPHGLVVGDNVYVRGGSSPGGGGPFPVSVVGGPTSFTLTWNTSALPAFVPNSEYLFGTVDPSNDIVVAGSALDTTRYSNDADINIGFNQANAMSMVSVGSIGRQVLSRFANERRSLVTVGNNSTTINLVGAATGASDGTATAVTTTATNRYTRTTRLRNVSAAGAGSNCGYRASDFKYFEEAGWESIVFGWETFVAGAAAFVGLRAGGAHGNVDPSTFTSCIGVGIDAGDSNWRLMHNDAAGVCTETDLGASFPANTSGTTLYELLLWWPPGAVVINWQLTNLSSGAVASGAATTNIPVVGLPVNGQVIANNRAVASAIDLSFSQISGGAAL